MKQRFIEIFGWYGTIAIILSYALVSFSIITSDNFISQLLNLTGAVGIIIVSFYKKAYQPAVLNIIWTVIAVIAIIRLIFK